MKSNPVVHFEMTYEDSQRLQKFFFRRQVFAANPPHCLRMRKLCM